MRDDKGQFVSGGAKTGEHSETFWVDLEPVKRDIVAAVRRQLAADGDDAPPTLLAIIDGFAEAHLLRKSTFLQLAQRGGPVTNKGKVRGLLQAWGTFFDREMRAAERLGLERRSRSVNKSPRDWLESLANNPREEDNANGHAPDLTTETDAEPQTQTSSNQQSADTEPNTRARSRGEL